MFNRLIGTNLASHGINKKNAGAGRKIALSISRVAPAISAEIKKPGKNSLMEGFKKFEEKEATLSFEVFFKALNKKDLDTAKAKGFVPGTCTKDPSEALQWYYQYNLPEGKKQKKKEYGARRHINAVWHVNGGRGIFFRAIHLQRLRHGNRVVREVDRGPFAEIQRQTSQDAPFLMSAINAVKSGNHLYAWFE